MRGPSTAITIAMPLSRSGFDGGLQVATLSAAAVLLVAAVVPPIRI